jgi:hypothetical protein
MSTTWHDLTFDRCIGFSNAELVNRLWRAIDKIDFGSSDRDERFDSALDELFFIVHEIVERFAPEAAKEEPIRRFKDGFCDSDDLLASLDALKQRQAARLLRNTFSGGDDV